MGYRSDCRLRTTKEGYEIMKKEIDKYLKKAKKEKDFDYEPKNVFEYCEKINIENEIVTADWNYMKWYEDYTEIRAFNNALGILQDKDIDFQFMRIGENLEDIEERWSVLNGSFDSFYVSREFED